MIAGISLVPVFKSPRSYHLQDRVSNETADVLIHVVKYRRGDHLCKRNRISQQARIERGSFQLFKTFQLFQAATRKVTTGLLGSDPPIFTIFDSPVGCEAQPRLQTGHKDLRYDHKVLFCGSSECRGSTTAGIYFGATIGHYNCCWSTNDFGQV